jgi:hypothetical protein
MLTKGASVKKSFPLAVAFLLALGSSESGAAGASGDEKAMQSIQKKARSLQSQMQRISEVPKIMEEFDPLLQKGQYKEAEAVLDRALRLLKEFKAQPAE